MSFFDQFIRYPKTDKCWCAPIWAARGVLNASSALPSPRSDHLASCACRGAVVARLARPGGSGRSSWRASGGQRAAESAGILEHRKSEESRPMVFELQKSEKSLKFLGRKFELPQRDIFFFAQTHSDLKSWAKCFQNAKCNFSYQSKILIFLRRKLRKFE